MNKLFIDDYVFKVPDNEKIVEQTLYDQAFSVGIDHLYKQCGWQGGTIHQILDYIMVYKKKWNNPLKAHEFKLSN